MGALTVSGIIVVLSIIGFITGYVVLFTTGNSAIASNILTISIFGFIISVFAFFLLLGDYLEEHKYDKFKTS